MDELEEEGGDEVGTKGGFLLSSPPLAAYRLPRELASLELMEELLRLDAEEEELPPILLALAEAEDDGTLEDLRGEMVP